MLPSVLHKAPPARFQRLLQVLQELAPTELAASWDNVGLLLDCLNQPKWDIPQMTPRLFLCNDLTERVAEEAIEKKVDCVITYHPTPFGKSNKITRQTHIGRVVLSMITNQIPVYATHTCLDCVDGGLNDWLLTAFGDGVTDVAPCEPSKLNPRLGFGRVATLERDISIDEAVAKVKALTNLQHLRRADPVDGPSKRIKHIAVCAGSGGSVFKAYQGKPDLVVTGEMSHHDVLELNQNGAFVLLCEHSNSERGFLPVLRNRLLAAYPDAEVVISEIDRDPLFVA